MSLDVRETEVVRAKMCPLPGSVIYNLGDGTPKDHQKTYTYIMIHNSSKITGIKL